MDLLVKNNDGVISVYNCDISKLNDLDSVTKIIVDLQRFQQTLDTKVNNILSKISNNEIDYELNIQSVKDEIKLIKDNQQDFQSLIENLKEKLESDIKQLDDDDIKLDEYYKTLDNSIQIIKKQIELMNGIISSNNIIMLEEIDIKSQIDIMALLELIDSEISINNNHPINKLISQLVKYSKIFSKASLFNMNRISNLELLLSNLQYNHNKQRDSLIELDQKINMISHEIKDLSDKIYSLLNQQDINYQNQLLRNKINELEEKIINFSSVTTPRNKSKIPVRSSTLVSFSNES